MILPNEFAGKVQDINLEALRAKGIKLLIFDIDNTLIPRLAPEPDGDVLRWLEGVKQQGFLVCLMTNNNGKRIPQFNLSDNEFHIHHAMKPLKIKFKRILRHFDVNAEEVCMIGDQVFTDVLGANRMKIYSILVDRLQQYGGPVRRLMHEVEDGLRRKYR